jgi:Flp pilus assembly protein TadD
MDYEERNLHSALHHYQMALTMKPEDPTIYNNLGLVFLNLNDEEGARQAFLKAIRLDPFLMEPRLNLVLMYKRNGEYSKAVSLLEENRRLNPEDDRTLFYLIEVYLASGKKPQALDLGKKILMNTSDADQSASLGSLFAQHLFSNMAFSFYFKALQIDPHNKNAFLEIGKLYGNLGQFNRAIVFWQEGLRYHPAEKSFMELIAEARKLLQEK